MVTKEETYAQTLVDLDAGEDIGTITDPVKTGTETADSSAAEATPPVEETPTDEFADWDKDKAIGAYRGVQSERDKAVNALKEAEERVAAKEREFDNLRGLMSDTVAEAQTQRQPQPDPNAPPPDFDAIDANTPGTSSYNYVEQKRALQTRQVLEQMLAERDQRSEYDKQFAVLKEQHPEVTEDSVRELIREHRAPGAITLSMLWNFKHQGQTQQKIATEARRAGIDEVSQQIATATTPSSIAGIAGDNKPPKQPTEADKAKQYAGGLVEMDQEDQKWSKLGIKE